MPGLIGSRPEYTSRSGRIQAAFDEGRWYSDIYSAFGSVFGYAPAFSGTRLYFGYPNTVRIRRSVPDLAGQSTAAHEVGIHVRTPSTPLLKRSIVVKKGLRSFVEHNR